MNLADLNKVALAMVTPGKGILAADESSGTIKKRFDAIKVESTEESRRDYREMLFRSSEAMSKYVSGVILYDETIWQNAKDGTPLVKLIEQAGAIPGIKVDEGTQALPNCSGELVTVGLDKLTGVPRFTLGSPELTGGLSLTALAIGLFGISEILINLEKTELVKAIQPKFKDLVPRWKDLREAAPQHRTLVGGEIVEH